MKTNSAFLALDTFPGINLERNAAKLKQLRFMSHSEHVRLFHAE